MLNYFVNPIESSILWTAGLKNDKKLDLGKPIGNKSELRLLIVRAMRRSIFTYSLCNFGSIIVNLAI
jgi:hypothetical protein